MPAPASPAPVSGPGALARRTDGGPAQKLSRLPDAKYGEQATYQADQRGAPLSQTPGPGGAPPAGLADLLAQHLASPVAQQVVPFSAPTNRPGEPVTTGAALGPGPGPEALGIAPKQIVNQDVSGKVSQYLPILEAMANMPDALPGSRMYVNLIKAQGQPQGPTQGPAAFPQQGGPVLGSQ